jgi:anion-transporting  ArsA/GET3 family ATPase
VKALIDRHRLIVCVGTGGVGKTTMSAAIGLAAARRGRRAIVLTIDPARALARSLGLASLAPGGERIALPDLPGQLDAAMLDQKRAWDAFVRGHAPSDAIADEILGNRFYQELSTSFAGSTEYMALEEVARLVDAGRHDLIVLDTPPASHALDFLSAPERIDPLLQRGLATALASAGTIARFTLRRLERVVGRGAIRDVMAFLIAMDALVDVAAARARHARALLRGGHAAFVLVAGPRQLVLAETAAMAARMRGLDAPLAAVVLNRVHAAPPGAPVLDEPWLRAAWDDAVAEARAEEVGIAGFRAGLPAGVAVAAVPEADQDVHSLDDLALIAERLVAAS